MDLTLTGTLVYADAVNGKIYKLETGAVLTGTPTHEDVGIHPVKLNVTNGTETVEQSFNIIVTDLNAPVAEDYSPLNSSSEVAVDGSLTLTFNEKVLKGTGNITIKKLSNNF